MTDDKLQRVIARLNGHSQARAFDAAKVVWNDTDLRLERPLIRTLKQGPRPFNRAAAAYAMGVVLHRPRVVAALEQVVNNIRESASQRLRSRGTPP